MSMADLGDKHPLSLIVPDGDATTSATITFLSPSGITGTVASAPTTPDVGKTWNSDGMTLNEVGVWQFTWIITGMGAGVEPYAVYVTATPPVPWAPSLREVADHIPQRTVPVDTPSSDPLMTFTNATIPPAEQVARQIRAAVRWVAGSVGLVSPTLYGQAQDVAAMRAAGLVEQAYPIRAEGLSAAPALLGQAEQGLRSLLLANEVATGTSAEQAAMPTWSFPYPTVLEQPRPTGTRDW